MRYFIMYIMLLVCFSGKANSFRSFYVNAFSPSSKEDGSMEHPFKSLNCLKTIEFNPGDCIFLCGNQVFEGNIYVKGIKSESKYPFTISSYGNGIPQISSRDNSGIIVDSCENICIKNVLVKGAGRNKGNTGSGIDVSNSRFVKIDSVEALGYQMNGIGINGGKDISITNSYAHDNGFNGIAAIGNGYDKRSLANVYIGYCVASNNAGTTAIMDNHSGSGILVGYITNTTIEFCEAMNNGWDMPRIGNGPVGIWGYEADSLTIQYCFSHHNKTSVGGKDGGGFDFDGGVTNSLMQYNLSMYNEGAGYGLFQYAGATEWKNNIIRYNVSIYDGSKNSDAGFFIWCDSSLGGNYPLRDSWIYKNVVISNQGHSIAYETGFSSGLKISDNRFILTVKDNGHIDGDKTKFLPSYEKNYFWSQVAEEKNKIQPVVIMDTAAVYKPMKYAIPLNVSISQLKDILKNYYLFNE